MISYDRNSVSAVSFLDSVTASTLLSRSLAEKLELSRKKTKLGFVECNVPVKLN